MPIHTGDEVDLKGVFTNLLKGSPTAVALIVVFYLGIAHVERMDLGHRESLMEIAGSLKYLHEEFNRRNGIADRAVTQIERLTHLVDKLNDRILATRP